MQNSDEFSTWAARLEFSFEAWRKRVADDLETWVARNNSRGWDRAFASLKDECHAPGCRYPIRDAESYHVIGVGNVCNLCYYLYMLVHSKAYFVALQQQDDSRQKKDDRFNK